MTPRRRCRIEEEMVLASLVDLAQAGDKEAFGTLAQLVGDRCMASPSPAALIGGSQDGWSCAAAAVAGVPAIVMPAGFTSDGLPVGLELMARPFDEATLLSIAAGYEASTDHRMLPPTTPPLDTTPKSWLSLPTGSWNGVVRLSAERSGRPSRHAPRTPGSSRVAISTSKPGPQPFLPIPLSGVDWFRRRP